MLEVVINTGVKSARDELVPLFQLAVLQTLLRAPGRRATAREVTDAATQIFKKRLDTAQSHIALSRLTERKLTELVTPQTDPRQYTITPVGEAVAKQTISAMLRVIGTEELTVISEARSNDPTKATGRRPTTPRRAGKS